MKFVVVPQGFVAQAFSMSSEMLEPLIQSGASGGDYTVDGVLESLNSGLFKLAILTDGESIFIAAVFEMRWHRDGETAFVHLLAGRKNTVSQDTWLMFRSLMEKCGAQRIEMASSGPQARLWRRLGFKPKYQVFEVLL